MKTLTTQQALRIVELIISKGHETDVRGTYYYARENSPYCLHLDTRLGKRTIKRVSKATRKCLFSTTY